MFFPSVHDPVSPSQLYGLAVGGAVLSAIFSCATYSSVHKTAFLISAIVGSIFCILIRNQGKGSEDSEKMPEAMAAVPGGLFMFGYAVPIMGGGFLLALSILESLIPSLLRFTTRDISWRRVTWLAGISLGYTVTNAAYQGYQYYHS